MRNFTAKIINQILEGENVEFVIDQLNTVISDAANHGKSFYFYNLENETGQWHTKNATSLVGFRQPLIIQKVLYQLRALGFKAEFYNEESKHGILIWWHGDKPVL